MSKLRDSLSALQTLLGAVDALALAGLDFKIGSTVVAHAKAGEYDTETKALVADLTSKPHLEDPGRMPRPFSSYPTVMPVRARGGVPFPNRNFIPTF
ncbi:MAG: hypothetical protein EPO01_19900 [Aquabacterium sp.]|nr:MAG: hypothetical protein EPO01_19900 [Aquabacterium sp.]